MNPDEPDEEEEREARAPAAPLGPAAAQAPRLRRLRRCRRRGLVHALGGVLALLIVAACFFVRLAAIGLPSAWVESLSERLSSDLFSVELSGVSFSLADMALHVGEARVYPKGSVEEPLVRASGAEILLSPRFSAPYAEWVRAVHLRAIVVRVPSNGFQFDVAGKDEKPIAVADFPPIAFSCRMSDAMGLRSRSSSGTVSCRGGIVRVDDFGADMHGPREVPQRLEGSFSCDPAKLVFRSRGKGRMDPAKLDALLRAVDVPVVADEIAKFSFAGAPPAVDADYEYDPSAGVRRLEISLRADAGGVYNGVPFTDGEGLIRLSGEGGWTKLDIVGLRVRRPEGEARATLGFDLPQQTLRFDAVSTADLKRVLVMIGVVPRADDLPLDFDNPTELRADGFVALRREDRALTAISLRVATPAISVRDMPGLRFDHAKAEGVFTNNVLDLASLRADALGGDLDGSVRLAIPAPPDREEMELAYAVRLRGISHAAWSALFGPPIPEDTGRADADLWADGPLADVVSLAPVRTRGELSLDVRNVSAFRIPFFSGLRDKIKTHLATFDPLADDRLKLHATMDAGVIRVESLRIEGGAISITGDGHVWTDGIVNLGVKVHLMNRRTWIGAGLYYLFSPLSSIFAVRATGPYADPSWDSEALFLSGTDVKPAVRPKPAPATP